ncbi:MULTISPECIES: DUF664 domain-containing protein [unclassified Rhodococcus (in: high G+C Gram-positive bacteria)]|uniref:mycothiol transferase n=1 Tax=unclassified Rhodococcus (in: high G+C Gram-positive bacteria) TaxID=192944 RepID=UPI001469ABA1|nr:MULTISPECIES: DUF664 domain-containing protein [unclassified Rhodococcus (in: high G+C Gram-positive bacteria)]NMD96432.1 DUF664 domain-containing protein [Rhodococcus sp. BL-253-APC-6A1W]NME80262.1 DUF664 domain-containing protein [Rhodococcus sp. 105337]
MTTNESELILSLLDNQYSALRNAVSDLTEEQARSVPSASSLSLASLHNHLVQGHAAAADRIAGTVNPDRDPVEDWQSAWLVDDTDSAAGRLARLDAVAEQFAAVLRAEPDLDRVVDLPADVARWLIHDGPLTVRFLALHQIEEWARHAGHADVIRESIDGATAATLSGATW